MKSPFFVSWEVPIERCHILKRQITPWQFYNFPLTTVSFLFLCEVASWQSEFVATSVLALIFGNSAPRDRDPPHPIRATLSNGQKLTFLAKTQSNKM